MNSGFKQKKIKAFQRGTKLLSGHAFKGLLLQSSAMRLRDVVIVRIFEKVLLKKTVLIFVTLIQLI